MNRRSFLGVLLGTSAATCGGVMLAGEARALPIMPLADAAPSDVQPAFLLGRSLHRMRRRAAARRRARRYRRQR